MYKMLLKKICARFIAIYKQSFTIEYVLGCLFLGGLTLCSLYVLHFLLIKFLPVIISHSRALFCYVHAYFHADILVPATPPLPVDLPTVLPEPKVPDNAVLPEVVPQDGVQKRGQVRTEDGFEYSNDSWPVVNADKVYMGMLVICIIGIILETCL